MYSLDKKEKKEVTELENLLFDEEGNPKKEVMEKERLKGFRLKELYEKQNELYLASCN